MLHPSGAETPFLAHAAVAGPNPLLGFPGLHRALQSVVWWQPPEQALATYPWETLFCRLLVHGLPRDRERLLLHAGADAARHALAHAPAGLFSRARWAHWHQRLGVSPVSPRPRRFADVEPLLTPPWD